jgi:hypothetical protein
LLVRTGSPYRPVRWPRPTHPRTSRCPAGRRARSAETGEAAAWYRNSRAPGLSFSQPLDARSAPGFERANGVGQWRAACNPAVGLPHGAEPSSTPVTWVSVRQPSSVVTGRRSCRRGTRSSGSTSGSRSTAAHQSGLHVSGADGVRGRRSRESSRQACRCHSCAPGAGPRRCAALFHRKPSSHWMPFRGLRL